ncbi:MAG: DUF4192 domain-containing protein [Actinobacteria bacterium]|nr:DUF4192 domain-containing protein [Actinomycetota bacterium]
MDRAEFAQLRITSPADAAQVVPYLIGFTPEESLVVCAIQRGRVEVTARVDLAEVMAAGQVEYILDRVWSRFPNADGFAVAYTSDRVAGWELLQRCDSWLPFGCQTMVIEGESWHTPDGATGVVDRHGEISAKATYLGLPRVERRADLESRFASPPDSEELGRLLGKAIADLPELHQKAEIIARTQELLARNLPADAGAFPDSVAGKTAVMTSEDAIRLSVLVQHQAARDLVLLSMNSGNAPSHARLWQNVVQSSPAHGAGMPLYLAGMAAWITGDGASAAIAVDRALKADPQPDGAHPALLLDGIVDQVIPPAAWDSMREAIKADTDPDVQRALAVDTPAQRASGGWPPATPAASSRPERATRRPPAPGIAI